MKQRLFDVLKRVRSDDGITLLETVIFVTILSIIILAIVFSTVQSLKRTQFNQRKVFATRYAEELEEWMRGEKEANWTTFSARSPGTYCINEDMTTCISAGTCWDENSACTSNDYSLGAGIGLSNGYKRMVMLTTSGSRVDVNITVDWVDGPNTFDVGLASTFSRWE